MKRALRNRGIASLGRFASVNAIPELLRNEAVSTIPSYYNNIIQKAVLNHRKAVFFQVFVSGMGVFFIRLIV
jgi:hypothetical protein